jgi:hypothetical protein
MATIVESNSNSFFYYYFGKHFNFLFFRSTPKNFPNGFFFFVFQKQSKQFYQRNFLLLTKDTFSNVASNKSILNFYFFQNPKHFSKLNQANPFFCFWVWMILNRKTMHPLGLSFLLFFTTIVEQTIPFECCVPCSTSDLQHVATRGKSEGKINGPDHMKWNQATTFNRWTYRSNRGYLHVASRDPAMLDNQRPIFNHVPKRPIWRMFNAETLGGIQME